MDLLILEFWARKWRHGVVLCAVGAGIAGCLAYYFAVTKEEGQRLRQQLNAVILGLMGAGFVALNFYYSDEISTARGRLERDKEAELERFKKEKDVEMRTVEKENISLRIAHGKLEESNLKEAKQVAILQSGVAVAKIRQAEAEKQLAEMKKRQTPRNLRIPSDTVLSILKTAPPSNFIIWYQQADAESALFAMGLNLRLQDAGWRIVEFKAIPSSIASGNVGMGDIDFVIRDFNFTKLPDSLQALLRVMEFAAIAWGGWGDPTLPDDTIRIVIHPKR